MSRHSSRLKGTFRTLWDTRPVVTTSNIVDAFGRPDVAEQVRAALTSFAQASVRGWIIDMRWNTGGVSSAVSRLRLARGRIYSRLRHNEVRSPDGTLIAMREDIDANGTALPFQRPLIILIGPGSMSGAESFAGP